MLCDDLEGWDWEWEREVPEGGGICILIDDSCYFTAESNTFLIFKIAFNFKNGDFYMVPSNIFLFWDLDFPRNQKHSQFPHFLHIF